MNPSTEEAQAGGSEVEEQSQLQREFEDSLGHTAPDLNKNSLELDWVLHIAPAVQFGFSSVCLEFYMCVLCLRKYSYKVLGSSIS